VRRSCVTAYFFVVTRKEEVIEERRREFVWSSMLFEYQ